MRFQINVLDGPDIKIHFSSFVLSIFIYLFIYFRNKDQEQHYYKWSCKKCLPPHLQNYRLQQEEKLDPQDILLFKSITEKVQRIIDFYQLLSVIKKKKSILSYHLCLATLLPILYFFRDITHLILKN